MGILYFSLIWNPPGWIVDWNQYSRDKLVVNIPAGGRRKFIAHVCSLLVSITKYNRTLCTRARKDLSRLARNASESPRRAGLRPKLQLSRLGNISETSFVRRNAALPELASVPKESRVTRGLNYNGASGEISPIAM